MKILDRENGDWVFLACQMVLACIMGVLGYMIVLCDGSTRWGITAAALAVFLGWLINEGLMVKYISTLPADGKAPEEEAKKVAKSWLSLRKKYHTLDEVSHESRKSRRGRSRRSARSSILVKEPSETPETTRETPETSVDPAVDSVETTVIPASEMQAYIERLQSEQEG